MTTATLLRGISSMATRQVLADLTAAYAASAAEAGTVQIESVGGVDAAKRVAAGEVFDVVILASDAIDKLLAAGHLLPGSKVDWVHSGVAVAVPAGAPLPDLSSEDAVHSAVLAAPSISLSTGPSGVALAKLFERWGIAEQIAPRMVQAPPGVPVGSLVAKGEVALGFQQLSELLHVQGIQIVGPLPPAIQITTTFSAGVGVHSQQADAARSLLAYLASPAAAEAKQKQGMTPA
ncbi:substrate-binding domain-containing protein [Acidovorax sp. GW101-3H11]|uniref:substrate-binding domain-containing protein n=1 Tax=Acidovorax sp. GW101-3H11 TaxID=1813946 RepID=UPI000AFB93ED|nr:substrate-binding domain-containing protein [Acidovorax sp. GW101-3H11]